MKSCVFYNDPEVIAGRDYGCYSWDGDLEDIEDMEFSVKICEYADEICDIHAISDKSSFTQQNPFGHEGQFDGSAYFIQTPREDLDDERMRMMT